MVLVDLTHTSHTHARTGVQRVCRSLYDHLAAITPVTPITYDPYRRRWRALAVGERATLESPLAATKRGARWSLSARLAGSAARWLRTPEPILPPCQSLIVPEIFSPAVAQTLPALIAKVDGPSVALFHDAIALKLPELTPQRTVARFPAYLRELLMFDGIAAVSEDSRQALGSYWKWLEVSDPPPIITLHPGISPPRDEAGPAMAEGPLTILSVGSLEGRKNQGALLAACERLWSRGLAFNLRLIGLANAETGRGALTELRKLQEAGRPISYDGPVDDDALHRAYQECRFTVYPSLMEGFGLPVLESLAQGKPCICSARGALGEATRGGGCLAIDPVDADTLAEAIERLLTQPDLTDALALAARNRKIRTWTDYAAALDGWMRSLKSREHIHPFPQARPS